MNRDVVYGCLWAGLFWAWGVLMMLAVTIAEGGLPGWYSLPLVMTALTPSVGAVSVAIWFWSKS